MVEDFDSLDDDFSELDESLDAFVDESLEDEEGVELLPLDELELLLRA